MLILVASVTASSTRERIARAVVASALALFYLGTLLAFFTKHERLVALIGEVTLLNAGGVLFTTLGLGWAWYYSMTGRADGLSPLLEAALFGGATGLGYGILLGLPGTVFFPAITVGQWLVFAAVLGILNAVFLYALPRLIGALASTDT